MKKVLGIVFVFGLVTTIFAGIRAKYISFSGQLPAGTTVQISITSNDVFEIEGSTHTGTYTYNYVVPSNLEEAGYDFSIPVSTQTIYIILHGELK